MAMTTDSTLRFATDGPIAPRISCKGRTPTRIVSEPAVSGEWDGFATLYAPPLPTIMNDLELTSLDGENGFVIQRIQSDDNVGFSVSSAGDINGDGFADLIIGAPNADRNDKMSVGHAYIVFGKGDGFAANFSLAALDGDNGFRLDGGSEWALTGSSVSDAGDVNGDGLADILVSATGADLPGRKDAGATYVVFGKTTGFGEVVATSSLDGINGFTIYGRIQNWRSGQSVSSAGDLNGDGFDDMIIGNPRAGPGGDYHAGETYVVFGDGGQFDPIVDTAALDGSNGFMIHSVVDEAHSGASVSGIGDINGDGFDDIIIGVPNDYYSYPGDVYIMLGRPTVSDADYSLSQLDVHLNWDEDGDDLGSSVSAAGDVNGDGIDDFVIAAGGADACFVIFGSSDGFPSSIDLDILSENNGFRIFGAPLAGGAQEVSAAGDVNGDGFDDVLIGGPLGDEPGASDAGGAWLIFGRASGFADIDLANLASTRGMLLRSGAAGEQVGRSVSGAGDINGDGFDDLIVGAPGGGKAYVVFGSPDFGAAPTIEGTENNDSLTGTSEDERLEGLGGDDTLVGGGGADEYDGGAGIDWADFSGAGERAVIDFKRQTKNDGAASGALFIDVENLLGSSGKDRLAGRGTDNRFEGGEGRDVLSGRDGADTLIGGERGDRLTGGEGADELDGGGGEDHLDGGDGFDLLVGGVRADAIFGGSDGDHINGGDGADLLFGENGDDTIIGGDGADSAGGGAGVDMIDGGNGDDTMIGGSKDDAFAGGEGTDWVDYGNVAAKITVDLARPQKNRGDAAGDSYVDIENLRGSRFDDSLRGDSQANVVEGREDDDTLHGGAGDDTLTGGVGADSLTGGGDADLFLLDNLGNGGADTIGDFVSGEDLIGLRAAVFGLAPGPLAPTNFRLGSAAQDFDDYIIYDPTNGALYHDPDGNGFAAQVLIATIENLAAVSAQDFIVG